MFDVLTYQKGGAVLRMLEQYLGPEPFRDGIRRYLDRHRYGNTETTDLWDAIEATSGEPVRAIMDTWIFQGGHPVVSVSSGSKGNVTLTQRRFRYQPTSGGRGRSLACSDPPAATGAEHHRLLMTEASTTFVTAEGLTEGVGPVIVNDGGWGFFRTRYDPEGLAAVTRTWPTSAPSSASLWPATPGRRRRRSRPAHRPAGADRPPR